MVNATTYDTQTTDSEGKATLTSGTLSTAGVNDLEVIHENIVYPTSITVVPVTDIIFDGENYTVAKDQSIAIGATAYNGTSVISDLLMTINSEKTLTNSRGKAVISFTGSGAGATEIIANCGNISRSVTVMDYLMYWKPSENIRLNVNYNVRRTLSVFEMYNGIRLSTEPQQSAGITFSYPNSKREEWCFEFDVKSFPSSHIQICGFTRDYTQLKAGNHVKVIVKDGVKKIYVNDALVNTGTNSDLFIPDLVLVGEITIDNIKIYGV